MGLPNFLTSEDVYYPFLKKSLFRWLAEIRIDGSREVSNAIRVAEARFLASARRWRGMEPLDMMRLGIAPEWLSEVESGERHLLSPEFFRIAQALGIEQDAESFWLLLEGAAGKRTAQIEFIKNCPSFGITEFRNVKEYLIPTPNLVPCVVIPLR